MFFGASPISAVRSSIHTGRQRHVGYRVWPEFGISSAVLRTRRRVVEINDGVIKSSRVFSQFLLPFAFMFFYFTLETPDSTFYVDAVKWYRVSSDSSGFVWWHLSDIGSEIAPGVYGGR